MLRQDGNLLVSGERSGRIQVLELQNKFVLKTYEENKRYDWSLE